mmetsp:Transcript_22374/g.43858  ORF Transcript_22374/g.43858 Transcript_22374/m.43858 type:complete len:823 (-) Transcript_22374:463-2931(-)
MSNGDSSKAQGVSRVLCIDLSSNKNAFDVPRMLAPKPKVSKVAPKAATTGSAATSSAISSKSSTSLSSASTTQATQNLEGSSSGAGKNSQNLAASSTTLASGPNASPLDPMKRMGLGDSMARQEGALSGGALSTVIANLEQRYCSGYMSEDGFEDNDFMDVEEDDNDASRKKQKRTPARQRKANKEELEWLESGEGFLAEEFEEDEEDVERRGYYENALKYKDEEFYVHRGPLLTQSLRKEVSKKMEQDRIRKEKRKLNSMRQNTDDSLSTKNVEKLKKMVQPIMGHVGKAYAKAEAKLQTPEAEVKPIDLYTRELDTILRNFFTKKKIKKLPTAHLNFVYEEVNKAFKDQPLADFKSHLKRASHQFQIMSLRKKHNEEVRELVQSLKKRGIELNPNSKFVRQVEKASAKATADDSANRSGTAKPAPVHPYGFEIWARVLTRPDGVDDDILEKLYFGDLDVATRDGTNDSTPRIESPPTTWAALRESFIKTVKSLEEKQEGQLKEKDRSTRAMCKGFLRRSDELSGQDVAEGEQAKPAFFWDRKSARRVRVVGESHKGFLKCCNQVWKREDKLFGKLKTQCPDQDTLKKELADIWPLRVMSGAEIGALIHKSRLVAFKPSHKATAQSSSTSARKTATGANAGSKSSGNVPPSSEANTKSKSKSNGSNKTSNQPDASKNAADTNKSNKASSKTTEAAPKQADKRKLGDAEVAGAQEPAKKKRGRPVQSKMPPKALANTFPSVVFKAKDFIVKTSGPKKKTKGEQKQPAEKLKPPKKNSGKGSASADDQEDISADADVDIAEETNTIGDDQEIDNQSTITEPDP